MEIVRADPLAVAEDAGRILREAWTPPVLRYSDEYLRFQLGFPGAPARAVIARESGELVGFAALTPRRLRLRGVAADAHILSFVAVRPAFRRRGLASQLYEELLSVLREDGLPALVFVEAGSATAQPPLFRAAERVGLRLHKLLSHQNYGFVARRGAPAVPLVPGGSASAVPLTAVELGVPDRALEAMEACGGDRVLWSAPDRGQLAHYALDPRPRRLLAIEEEGRVTGAAMVLLSEIVTSSGIDRIATLDAIFLPEPTPPRVAALARGAALAFSGQATLPAVSAPSLSGVDPEVIKAAGLRPTGFVFDAFLCHAGDHPFAAAESTNLEVV